VASQSGFRFSPFRILPVVKYLFAVTGVPPVLIHAIHEGIANRTLTFCTALCSGRWGQCMPVGMRGTVSNKLFAVALEQKPRSSPTDRSRGLLLTSVHPSKHEKANPLGCLLWAVFMGFALRLIVVGLVYKGFLDPARDHWEFGYEIGRVARSIDIGRGFADPYWADTGSTALLCPVYPYLMAGVFGVFGIYTRASALVFLALNSFLSTITSVPIFFIARKSFDLRTAKLAAWVWAFFPYAINFSATTMWYHSFTGLLLAMLFLVTLSLASSDQMSAWAGFGVLFGVAALTNPVILGVAPFLGGWLCIQLARQRKRVTAASAIGILAMSVTILPWPIRNDLVLHRPILFKDGFWMEVCVGNVNNSLHWWDGEEHPSGSTVEREQYQRLGEIGYMEEKRRRAIEYIENHPGRYAIRSLRHVVFMWTGFWSFNHEYLRQEPFDPENIFFLSSLSILSFAGLYRGIREARTKTVALAYLLVLLSFPVPYYLSHVDPGFRHPVDPLLTILACSAVGRWFRRPGVVTAAGERTDDKELVLG
jgi:Dolichyl-phosphate-mannose-protein mannosyltransferase